MDVWSLERKQAVERKSTLEEGLLLSPLSEGKPAATWRDGKIWAGGWEVRGERKEGAEGMELLLLALR